VRAIRHCGGPRVTTHGWGTSIGLPGEDWFQINYTKREYRIPMRDGVRLFTVTYTGDHPDPEPNPSAVRLGHCQQLVHG